MSKWSIFDEEYEEPYLVIKLQDNHTGRYIHADVKDDTWPEVVRVFVDMLTGLGFVIDKIEAENVIAEWQERNKPNE